MVLKNSVIMSPDFIPAVEKLLKVELTVKDCIALSETITVLNERLGILEKAKLSIMERFAKKDEEGNMVTQPTAENPNLRIPLFESQEIAKEFGNAINDLLDEESELPLVSKIKIREDVKLKTSDFMAIKDLIEVI